LLLKKQFPHNLFAANNAELEMNEMTNL